MGGCGKLGLTITDEGMAAGNALDDSWTWTAVYWTQAGGPVAFGGEEAVALGATRRAPSSEPEVWRMISLS